MSTPSKSKIVSSSNVLREAEKLLSAEKANKSDDGPESSTDDDSSSSHSGGRRREKQQEGKYHIDNNDSSSSISSPMMVKTPTKTQSVEMLYSVKRGGSVLVPRAVDNKRDGDDNSVSSDKAEGIGGGLDDNSYDSEDDDTPRETIAVFNANTTEGEITVKALSKSGDTNVVAIVRVFTSKCTKDFLKMKNVTVKVSDSHDREALSKAIKGVDRAIFVTKYWEKFDNWLEESQASVIIDSCYDSNVKHLIFSTFEDIKQLTTAKKKSQIIPKKDGTIQPKFVGMDDVRKKAKAKDIELIHMMTSYLDQTTSKKSLCLISSPTGKLVVQPHFMER